MFVVIPSVSYVNTHVPSRFTAVEDHSAWAVGRTRTANTARTSIIILKAHKPQNPGSSSPPIDARAESPRTWTTVDARTIRGGRNVVVSVVARLGGAGEALPLVVHSRKSDSRDSRRVADRRAAVGARTARPKQASNSLRPRIVVVFLQLGRCGRARRPSRPRR